jgi:hypothetical protein
MPSRRLLATAALALLAPAVSVREPPPHDSLPRLFLWAWERPDDLRHLPHGTGVAFLAQTITIAGRSHVVSHRRQALHVDEGTPMMAVTRIEAPGDVAGVSTAAIAREIADRGRLPMVTAVQIDFDARASQRAMYRQLLHDVRAALPAQMPLSMTALASWCMDDDWLDELPVDEAVPMLFRMGPASAPIRQAWPSRRPAEKCRGSIGVSLDEPAPRGFRPPRVYVFNPQAWTPPAVSAALEVGR